MRRIIAASLLLSPLFIPAAAVASQPVKDDTSASTQVRPVSTGVTAPSILHTTDIIVSPDLVLSFIDESKVVLKLNVDEQGKPEDIQIVNTVNPTLGADVLDAVRQFRWYPAKLDNQPIATDLTLNVVVKR
jgi:TonB family protein